MAKPPAAVAAELDGADDSTLRATIAYCEAQLGSGDIDDESERHSEPPDEFEGDTEQWEAAVADCEAPSRATLTEKEISGNLYLYYQWSEDGKTRSEYVAPKNPKR